MQLLAKAAGAKNRLGAGPPALQRRPRTVLTSARQGDQENGGEGHTLSDVRGTPNENFQYAQSLLLLLHKAVEPGGSSLYLYTETHTSTCTNTQIATHMSTHTLTHIHKYTPPTHIHLHTHTYTHVYTYSPTHTHINTLIYNHTSTPPTPPSTSTFPPHPHPHASVYIEPNALSLASGRASSELRVWSQHRSGQKRNPDEAGFHSGK